MYSDREREIEELERKIQAVEVKLIERQEKNIKRLNSQYRWALGCVFTIPIIVAVFSIYIVC